MSSRVLLVSVNRCQNPDPVFPLGLAYVSAALRDAGHAVAWFDVLASTGSFEQTLAEFRPDYVGLSLRNIDDVILRKQEVFFDQLESLCTVTHQVAGCPVILGGSGFSIFPEPLLQFSGADYGIVGAGETPMVALIEALENGQDVSQIPGLVYGRNGIAHLHPPPCRVSAGARVDRPEEIASFYITATSTLNVQTQRGCPWRCCYCTYPLLEGRTNQRRAPEAVAEDFAQASRLGAKYLFVVDSVFNSSHAHVTGVCEAILQSNLNLKWGCFLRPQNLTPEVMGLMARAGLAHIEFGSDSLSDTVLEQYHKGLTFEDIRISSEMARAQGIEFCHFLISGGPGETPETLHEGFDNSRHLPGAVVMAMPGMRIYPGTPLHERALREGRVSRETNLLAPSYYLAPGLEAEQVYKILRDFSRASSNWIVGDSAPAFTAMVRRLRQRGVMGPLWSYASIVQRLWPSGFQNEFQG